MNALWPGLMVYLWMSFLNGLMAYGHKSMGFTIQFMAVHGILEMVMIGSSLYMAYKLYVYT